MPSFHGSGITQFCPWAILCLASQSREQKASRKECAVKGASHQRQVFSLKEDAYMARAEQRREQYRLVFLPLMMDFLQKRQVFCCAALRAAPWQAREQ